MDSRPERDPHQHRRTILSITSAAPIRAVAAVGAITSGAGMFQIGGARAAGGAIQSGTATRTAVAVAPGKIRGKLAVILHGNVEIRAQVRMARHRDAHMSKLSVTDAPTPCKR